MRLTLLDLQPIFACFGDLSSTIMAVSEKAKASRSILAKFSVQNDRYLLSKTAIRDRFEAQTNVQNQGMTTACSTTADTARLLADRSPKRE